MLDIFVKFSYKMILFLFFLFDALPFSSFMYFRVNYQMQRICTKVLPWLYSQGS